MRESIYVSQVTASVNRAAENEFMPGEGGRAKNVYTKSGMALSYKVILRVVWKG